MTEACYHQRCKGEVVARAVLVRGRDFSVPVCERHAKVHEREGRDIIDCRPSSHVTDNSQ